MTLHLTIRVPNWLDLLFAFPLLTFRRLRFGYPFRKIRLTDVSGVAQAKSEGKFTIVDPADFYRLNSFYWLTCGKNDNLYAARLIRLKSGRLGTVLMHREIYFNCSTAQISNLSRPVLHSFSDGGSASNGPALSLSNGLVDHINTDSLDNRRANLRLATHSQNSCNSRRDKSNTYSRFRGVSFSKRKQKFFAAIRANGKKTWLGYFKTEIDAARAYDEAAKKYHEEFARLNFS
jgi:hypothetical protein